MIYQHHGHGPHGGSQTTSRDTVATAHRFYQNVFLLWPLPYPGRSASIGHLSIVLYYRLIHWVALSSNSINSNGYGKSDKGLHNMKNIYARHKFFYNETKFFETYILLY